MHEVETAARMPDLTVGVAMLLLAAVAAWWEILPGQTVSECGSLSGLQSFFPSVGVSPPCNDTTRLAGIDKSICMHLSSSGGS
jgi:hypothetical protein